MAEQFAYVDTSAIVKRYVREAGSTQLRRFLHGPRLVTSAVMPVELLSALYRRHLGGDLNAAEYARATARFRGDREYWELVELSPLVLSRAEEIVQRVSTHTLDAIHIASALLFQEALGARGEFLTADARQRASAAQVGMQVRWIG